MKKILSLITVTLFLIALLFTACQPTEINQAKLHMDKAQYEKAIEQCKIALEKQPDNAYAFFIMGKAYAETGKFKEMNDAFNKSLAISDRYAEEITNHKQIYWFKIFNNGISSFKNENMEDAANFFELSIEILPDEINGYKNLAISYSKLDKNDESVKILNEAIKIFPDDLLLKQNLGVIYYQTKQYEEAINTFELIAEKTKSDTSEAELYSIAIRNIAFSYDLLGNSDKALTAYKDAIEQFPDNKDLLFNLGRLNFMQKDYESAITNFKKVSEINPNDYDSIYNIGNAYFQLEKYEEAIPFYLKAIEIKPDNYDAWTNLGIVYVRSGMTEKGKAAFDKAEEFKPPEE